ncbi:MAG: class I SAM-dependent DNA methyltransferase [Lachnospiraceae bacterium]
MDNIPYTAWAEHLTSTLRSYGIEDGILLDLGCGTGTLTQLMAQRGYDMIGIDAAPDMLQEAMQKQEGQDASILYLLQDMREFELYGTVRAILSSCDSLNYILEEEELLEVFRLANMYLDPGGLLLFDLHTPYYYEQIVGNTTIAENRAQGSFIWENEYDPDTQLNQYELTLFLPVESEEDPKEKPSVTEQLYCKRTEFHEQRAYSLERIKALLEEAGLRFVQAYDSFDQTPVCPVSQRLHIVAQECKKETTGTDL